MFNFWGMPFVIEIALFFVLGARGVQAQFFPKLNIKQQKFVAYLLKYFYLICLILTKMLDFLCVLLYNYIKNCKFVVLCCLKGF